MVVVVLVEVVVEYYIVWYEWCGVAVVVDVGVVYEVVVDGVFEYFRSLVDVVVHVLCVGVE